MQESTNEGGMVSGYVFSWERFLIGSVNVCFGVQIVFDEDWMGRVVYIYIWKNSDKFIAEATGSNLSLRRGHRCEVRLIYILSSMFLPFGFLLGIVEPSLWLSPSLPQPAPHPSLRQLFLLHLW